MPKSIIYAYITARRDAPDTVLMPGSYWIQGEQHGAGVPFKIAAVPRERAGHLLDRLREANALYAPQAFRFIFPTAESALLNAQALQRKDAS